ncbi:alpha/beta hydrolase [Kibdelosporangium aridum]|uniref:Lysophospholipase, alpha-beta hydrolase superfamily n=1 Tax=Kibdelosporangium aridum TaxID=2030 RepID=A0A1Y5X605_KIBAR|nr:alpha/beta fold hydrolase [Kibdelosporangium aridum]SMC72882.1 Lysophospholipase, alpha-beta hydrolase superfamily [Kibdelosporangium aridum]
MISRFVAAAVLTTALLTPVGVATADPDSPSCVQADVPVHTLTVIGTMHGTLCLPAGPTPDTVMVLVPGATYNSVYWDFPYQPNTYSFTRAMTQAGYATFAVDRLGTGQSTRPLSAQLTALVQADAVHDVIQALRAGSVGGTAFSKVIVGGHSLGSIISIIEAATYQDVDALLVTGASHQLNTVNSATLVTVHLRSVALTPGFPNHDAGYLTTVPGHRKPAFHDPDFVEPAVIALDEATKDVVSSVEAPDGLTLGVFAPYSALVDVPVMVTIGERDPIFCGALAQCTALFQVVERPYYLGAPSVDFFVLPTAGHSINLNPDAPAMHDAVVDWADSVL